MNIALIGAGGIAQVHCAAFERIPDMQVVAVADPNLAAAQAAAQRFGARAYASLDETLAAGPIDAVDICAPTYLHAELTTRCLDAGLHVLCEKPMAMNRAQADTVMAAWQRSGRFLMIAQVLRFWPEYSYLKQVFQAKTFGALRQAEFSRTSAAPGWGSGWYVDPARSGMAPFELHVHDLDFIYYLLGQPTGLSARGWREDSLRASYLRTQLEYPGLLVEAEAGWYAGPLPFAATYRAVFERAVLDYRPDGLWLHENDARESRLIDLSQAQDGPMLNLPATDAYFNEIDYFCSCLRSGKAPQEITPPESRAVIELLFRALEISQ